MEIKTGWNALGNIYAYSQSGATAIILKEKQIWQTNQLGLSKEKKKVNLFQQLIKGQCFNYQIIYIK